MHSSAGLLLGRPQSARSKHVKQCGDAAAYVGRATPRLAGQQLASCSPPCWRRGGGFAGAHSTVETHAQRATHPCSLAQRVQLLKLLTCTTRSVAQTAPASAGARRGRPRGTSWATGNARQQRTRFASGSPDWLAVHAAISACHSPLSRCTQQAAPPRSCTCTGSVGTTARSAGHRPCRVSWRRSAAAGACSGAGARCKSSRCARQVGELTR